MGFTYLSTIAVESPPIWEQRKFTHLQSKHMLSIKKQKRPAHQATTLPRGRGRGFRVAA